MSSRALLDSPDVAIRFWAKVEKTGDCWLWTGSRSRGYGTIRIGGRDGRSLYTHVLSYEKACGPVPDGRVLDHLCRVRHCVNPAHLEVVDQRTNILRGDGVAARNAQKTHCERGHEFTPENTITRWRRRSGGGWLRECRECRRSRRAESVR